MHFRFQFQKYSLDFRQRLILRRLLIKAGIDKPTYTKEFPRFPNP